MNDEAMAENESIRPRFLDFKVYADGVHHAAGFGANLRPWSTGGHFSPGEWESSKIYYPNTASSGAVGTVETEIVAVGANYPGVGASGHDAVSMIEGYANSRSLPNVLDPNTPDDAIESDGSKPENWMTAIFNDGTNQYAEVIDVLTDENNIAPYPFENDGVNVDTMYPNGELQAPGMELVDQSWVNAVMTDPNRAGLGTTTRLMGSNFPCGLIRLDIFGFSTDTNLFIDLVPGHHRGYLAESMVEM